MPTIKIYVNTRTKKPTRNRKRANFRNASIRGFESQKTELQHSGTIQPPPEEPLKPNHVRVIYVGEVASRREQYDRNTPLLEVFKDLRVNFTFGCSLFCVNGFTKIGLTDIINKKLGDVVEEDKNVIYLSQVIKCDNV